MPSFKRILPLLGLALCLAGARAQSNSELVASARKNLASGHYAEAERLFEQAVNNDPHDMEAWEGYKIAYEKSRTQEENGDRPAARSHNSEPASADRDSQPDDATESTPPPPTKRPRVNRRDRSADTDDGESVAPAEEAGPTREEIGKVDPALVRNVKRAKERFEEAREERSGTYKRLKNGAVSVAVTYYDRTLYRLLAAYVAAKRKRDVHDAQKFYEQSVADQHDQLEFYVKLSNYSEKPKISIPIVDIVDHTVLLDDKGNAYKPVRWKGPKRRDLVEEDTYTVWFSRSDSEGEEILKQAGKTCWLTISDMAQEAKSIQIEFATSLLRGDSKGVTKTKPRSFTDRMKNLFK